jgi:HD superfamily phosphohydrolase YqeK
MTDEDVTFFKKWFSQFCKSFYSMDIEDQKNITLKENHTLSVCKNIVEISRGLSLDNNDTFLAEIVALFHDIGRFPQYAQYKTFKDSISVNHGLLGAQTLMNEKVLQNLSEKEQHTIIQAVKYHNAFSIPKKQKEDFVFFIKLIRDADKLDIWRVFIEYYEAPLENRASAASLGFPDTNQYSVDILQNLYKKKIIPLSKVKTLHDFQLLQLSWVYDLNFMPSIKLLFERKYIDRITASLPKKEDIHKALSSVKEYLQQRLMDKNTFNEVTF